ncbi:MAG: hypothetical protein K2W78_10105 [Xanthobacteraceae bacterium]|nr:hypothetical protein [Xanthobacteraceae bacterium]
MLVLFDCKFLRFIHSTEDIRRFLPGFFLFNVVVAPSPLAVGDGAQELTLVVRALAGQQPSRIEAGGRDCLQGLVELRINGLKAFGGGCGGRTGHAPASP